MAEGRPDDVAFIGKLLDDLGTVVKVNEKRVYACGMSNGGMMCYRLAAELSDRLASIFLLDGNGRRPVLGDQEQFQGDPRWHDHIPFYEYFHGDNGRGVGASHQTGWTALVAKLLDTRGRWRPVEQEAKATGVAAPRRPT